MLHYDEPEHIRLLRESLRAFVATEMPRQAVREWDRDCRFPAEVFRKLADMGVCGLTIDEQYGGAGRDLVAAVAELVAVRSGIYAITVQRSMNISRSGVCCSSATLGATLYFRERS